MPRIEGTDVHVRVFTFKEGLLSAIAHDLEIEVTRASLEWPDDASLLRAEIDARSLRVLHAVLDGRPAPGALSDRDKRKIEQTIVEDVLHASRHPSIRFEGTLTWPDRQPAVPTIEGRLDLHGRSRSVAVTVEERGDAFVATATLHQPDFGIAPYSAMLGTLKLKADVRVEVRVPLARPPIRVT
jgi:polyisoprenoid-binding protein YceI